MKRSTSFLIRFGLLGLGIALLAINHLAEPTRFSLPFQMTGTLPSTVEFQPLDRWGAQRLTAALAGVLVLLLQSAAFGVVCLRQRRKAGLTRPLILLASGFWAVTVVLTFWLSAATASSLQLWESRSPGNVVLSLPRVFAARALPGCGEVFYAAAAVSLFAACSASLGMAILVLLRRRNRDALGQNAVALIVTAFLVGQGILSCVFVLLSIFGLLTYLGVSVCLLLCLACGLDPSLSTVRAAFRQVKEAAAAMTHVPVEWRIVAGLAVALVALAALQAWARLSWDAGSNYFASAKLMALSHKFQYTNESYLAVSGFNAETTQAALIALFGERSARLASWLMGVSFIILCAAIARDVGVGRVGTIVAVAMVCTTTAFVDLMGDGKTDLYGAAMAMAALYWLLRPSLANRLPSSVLVGLFSGFSLLYRPNYVLPLALLILWAVIRSQVNHQSRGQLRGRVAQIARDCLFIATFAALPVVFYLTRNLLVLSEPLVSVHSAASAAQFAPAKLQDWGIGPAAQALIRLIYPFFGTFITTPQSLGALTPLLLASTPLLFLYRRSRPNIPVEVRQLGAIAALTLVLWLVLLPFIQEIRYVLALWGLIFVVVGCYAEKILQSESRVAAAITALLLVSLMTRAVYGVGVSTDRPVGESSPQCAGVVQCNVIDAINREAGPGARVLVLAPYMAYLRPDLLFCASTIQEIQALREASQGGPEAFWRKAYELGYDYVAYFPDYAGVFTRVDTTLAFYEVPAWLDREVLYTAQQHTAFRLRVTSPPVDTFRRSCQQRVDGGWTVLEGYGN